MSDDALVAEFGNHGALRRRHDVIVTTTDTTCAVLRPSGSRSIGPDELEIETDHNILSQRQKQIDSGKNTENYKRFMSDVPMESRYLWVRRTPDKKFKLSREHWDNLVKKWRLDVHRWAVNTPISVSRPSLQFEIETDPDILSRRQKQIEYGKNTENYKLYASKVPLNSRRPRMPQTPDKKRKLSRKHWDSMVKRWKLNVHQWTDDIGSDNNTQWTSTKQGSRRSQSKSRDKERSQSRSQDGHLNRERSHSRERRRSRSKNEGIEDKKLEFPKYDLRKTKVTPSLTWAPNPRFYNGDGI